VIRLEAPGIDPEKDVEIAVEAGTLRIRAGRQAERFEESLSLPAGVGADDVVATYGEGVVEVVVPKAAKQTARRVRISSSGKRGSTPSV
jgi:HSP20 family protein